MQEFIFPTSLGKLKTLEILDPHILQSTNDKLRSHKPRLCIKFRYFSHSLIVILGPRPHIYVHMFMYKAYTH